MLSRIRAMRKLIIQILIFWSVSTTLPAMQQCCELFVNNTVQHEKTSLTTYISSQTGSLAEFTDGQITIESDDCAQMNCCTFSNDLDMPRITGAIDTLATESFIISPPPSNNDKSSSKIISFYVTPSVNFQPQRSIYLITKRLRI